MPPDARMYRALFEQLPDGALVLDRALRVVAANARAAAALGTTAERLVGAEIAALVDAAHLEASLRAALAGETATLEATSRFAAPDDARPLAIRLSPLRDDDRGVEHLLARLDPAAARESDDLRDREERYALAWKGTSDGLWDLDLVRRRAYLSPRMRELLGYDEGELGDTPEALRAIIHPDDLPRLLAAYEAHATRRERCDVEVRLRHRDGAWRHFRVRGQAVWNDAGRPRRMVGSIADVTPLREAEALFRGIAEQAVLGVYLLRDRRVVYVNPRCAEMFGLTPAEMLDVDVTSLIAPEERARVADAIRSREQGGPPMHYVTRGLRTDQTTFDLEVFGNSLDTARGRLVIGTLLDVTARTRAELALRESEDRYRRLVELSPEPILVHVDGRIAFANVAAARVLGASSPGQLVGRSIAQLAHPDFRATVSDRVQRVTREGQSAALMEQRYVRLDGAAVDVEVASLPMTYDGKPAMLSVARDITARKRAEAQMAEALAQADLERRRLAATLEALPLGVWIADADGRVTHTSAAADAMLRGEGGALRNAWAPDTERPIARDDWPLRRALRGGETVLGEAIEIEQADGKRRFVLASSAPIRASDGRITGAVAVALDATDRREAERERERLISSLQFERGRLATVFQKAPAFIAVVRGRDHVFELANEAYRALLGARPIVGERIDDVLPELRDQGFVALLDRVLDTGEPQVATGVRMWMRDADRSPDARLVSFVAQPLVEEDGTRSAVFVHGVDVTEQANAEAATRASEQRVRAQFKAVPVPTYAWQATVIDGQRDFVLVDYNDAAMRITRDGIAGLVGRRLSELFAGEPLVREDVHRSLDEAAIVRRDLDHVLQTTGEHKRLSITYAPVPPDLVLAHTEDVTERHHLEEQLRQAQKMEAVGRLAGGIAHDFNNLLTVIQAYARSLAEDLDVTSPLRADAIEIDNAAVRAAALTKQLLAFSRKQVLQPRSLDLNAVLSEMEPMLRRLIGEDVAIVLRRDPSLGRVLADRGQLEQVVMNLAVNARDAMPEGGTLALTTASVVLDEPQAMQNGVAPAGPYARIDVRDTGVGMDAETRRRIFEPFFTTKEPGRGTGLGLSTVYGIVQQTGGYLGVRSEPGRGTTFTILLPRHGPEVAQAESIRAAPIDARGREAVLLVEDEDAVRALCRRVLDRHGYAVLEARDGQEALRLADARQGAIDLLLTDVVMPTLGGRQLYDRLRAMRPGLRVLFMSGYNDDEILRRGTLGGGTAFLQKPFTAGALAEAVRAALDAPA